MELLIAAGMILLWLGAIIAVALIVCVITGLCDLAWHYLHIKRPTPDEVEEYREQVKIGLILLIAACLIAILLVALIVALP